MKLKKQYHKLNSNDRLYQTSIPVIGLTGGIATGKSTVSELLKSEKIPVICADELVKRIYKFESTISFIKSNYPEVMEDDTIDFTKLREKFFTDTKTKEDIEKLIYAKLPEAWKEAVEKLENPKLIFYDVPLLFEKKLEDYVDLTVLVYASRDVQKLRLIERDQILEKLAEEILNHQMSIDVKKEKADFILNNSGTIEELASVLEDFLQQIMFL